MEKKMRFPYRPSTQKLIAVASLSAALLCSFHAVPAFAETADTSAVNAPVVTTETTAAAENTSPAAAENSQPDSPAAPTTTPTTDQTPAVPTENTSPTPQSSGWRQENGQFHYYKEDGTLVTSQWIKDDSGWHYVDAAGNAAKGLYTTPNGKTWYFDPTDPQHKAIFGEVEIDGKFYYFDSTNGLVTNGWVYRSASSWSWATEDGTYYSGWKHMPNGKWFYFDPEEPRHRMLIGTIQVSGTSYYIDEYAGMISNSWIQLPTREWAWAQKNGALASGWFNTPNGRTWYFDPSVPQHPALIGNVEIDGTYYHFDENYGILRNSWTHNDDGSWSWVDTYGSFYSGWKHFPNGKWFYFDPEDSIHRMKTGLFQLPSGSYYVDENAGMTSSNWVSLPDGNFSWAQSDGSLVSGWFTTPGNKTWYFNPSSIDHAAYVGEHSIDGKNYYFDKSYGLAKNEWVTLSNGVKRWAGPDGVLTGFISPEGVFSTDDGSQPTGTVHLPGLTINVGSDHKIKTGWIKENNKDFYYLSNGAPADGWLNIHGTWYYFNSNGEKQTGWINSKGSWYFLDSDGKMKTGWIKDNGKDYYLSNNGSMQTGYVTWGGKLYWSAADGAMEEQPCYYPDMYRYAQNYYSATNWLIQIDTTGNRFAVYRGSHGNWVVWYEWQCTTGAPGMWTPHGQFTVGNKGLYFGSGFRCWYYTTISGEYLIHSILYNSDGYTVRDGRLGYNGSHGCVRLATENAKWVYDNIPYGTKIVIW